MNDNSKFIERVKASREPSCTGAYPIEKIYGELKRQGRIHVDLGTFRKIIRTMGENISQLMLDGYIVKIPQHMGSFMVIQKNIEVKFKNGKVVHNRLINWVETFKLWDEDEQYKKKKQYVYYMSDVIYTAIHDRWGAEFKNKMFFRIRPASSINRKLFKYAKENNVTYHKTYNRQ